MSRLPAILGLSALLLAACSQKSEQASEQASEPTGGQATAEVASAEAHIVYYAIPG